MASYIILLSLYEYDKLVNNPKKNDEFSSAITSSPSAHDNRDHPKHLGERERERLEFIKLASALVKKLLVHSTIIYKPKSIKF